MAFWRFCEASFSCLRDFCEDRERSDGQTSCLHQSNFPSAIKKTPILAAKWVFLEWFAHVCRVTLAVETLWKLFFAKMQRDKYDD
jgi:hypothetical protein